MRSEIDWVIHFDTLWVPVSFILSDSDVSETPSASIDMIVIAH
jgi:hypothetical protein